MGFVLETSKHSQTRTLIWIVLQLRGAAATFHSVMSYFPLFFLHLSFSVALRGKACCYTCFIYVSSWGFTHRVDRWGCLYVHVHKEHIHQHSTNVLERGNPAWLDRETSDPFSICFYGVRRSKLAMCGPHTHELDHHTPVKPLAQWQTVGWTKWDIWRCHLGLGEIVKAIFSLLFKVIRDILRTNV